uniref:Uncharacterized protein n=1 Tax=Nelumbo nucifera TaxID=4432 RepID=A0A822YE30_NELNU|nr:TPA_asm: hypothetical protein HUJ06_031229 [Nelumbo nucifera]
MGLIADALEMLGVLNTSQCKLHFFNE